MKTQKFIKLLFVSCLIISLGCKKHKNLTTVNFHLYNPVTNEPYAGVKVKVLQDKQTGGGLNIGATTETIWEGVTDANGKASHSFKAKNGANFFYWQYVDQNFTQNPNYEFLILPEFLPLNKNEVNEVVYKTVKKVNFVTWIKNVDCFDQNDKMRYRRKDIADIFDNWTYWIPIVGAPSYPNGFYEGCFEHTHTYAHTQKIWDIEMEVTKNGVTSIVRDTFYITGQNGTDTLKLFY